MSDPLSRLHRFLRELKRRNVYRVAVVYAVVAFVVVQVADLTFVRLGLPPWTVTFIIVLASLGLPLALVLAWAFEVTPEGVRRTPTASEETGTDAPSPRGQSRLAVKALVGLGLVAAAAAGGWYLMGGGGEPEPLAGDRSIAVLPFENMGGEESEQFTRGVQDDLLTRLSNISGLKVISRTSVMRYEDTDMAIPEIARELNVNWVVEGGVQQVGDKIKVNAQLIDPRSDTHAWADQYRRDFTAENLFAIQSDITEEIARALRTELSPRERERVDRRPTENLEAYRLYVQGRRLLDERTAESMREAAGYFQRALERDSAYALAWAGLADALNLLHSYDFATPERVSIDPETAARRAVELDPDLAEAHTALAGALLFRVVDTGERDLPAGIRRLRRAVDLRPSYPEAHHWLGAALLLAGRPDRGVERLSLAAELHPRNAATLDNLAHAYLATGQYEKALEVARRHRRFFPESSRTLNKEILALHHLGRRDELRALAREALAEGYDDAPFLRAVLALDDAVGGDRAEARNRLAELKGEGADPVILGAIHAALGEEDAAFAQFESIEVWVPWLVINFRYLFPETLGPLRDDPRWKELIRGINVDLGLNPDGSLPEEAAR